MESQEPSEVDRVKVFNAHTFSLSISLPEGKTIEDITHEDAVKILAALPLHLSFCTERPQNADHVSLSNGAQPLPTNNDDSITELGLPEANIAVAPSQRNSLAEKKGGYSLVVNKDPHTGAWSLADIPRTTAANLVDAGVQTETETATGAEEVTTVSSHGALLLPDVV